MIEVVSVRFVNRGKVYFFAPNGILAQTGQRVIVETAKGLDIGECTEGNHFVDDEKVISPLRPVVRIATADDVKTEEENKKLEKEAFNICKAKIIEHGLDMKLVGVECGFEGNKILFFFTSDDRVDFRELVKDLASVFRTRIELRQIGVRDETKLMGGLGICGRPYCCSQFLNDFEPVSTKMAKTQSMSLNPTKISGSCGRLMCCLRYEQEAYEDLVKTIPKNGAFVQTVSGYGNVVQTNILRQKVKVRMDGEGDPEVKTFEAAQVASVPGGRPKPGEELPNVLHYVAPTKLEEPEEDPWRAPILFAEQSSAKKAAGDEGEKKEKTGSRKNRNKQRRSGKYNAGQDNAQKQPAQNVQQQQAKQLQNNNQQPNAPKQEEKKGSQNRNRRFRNRPKNTGGGGNQNSGNKQ